MTPFPVGVENPSILFSKIFPRENGWSTKKSFCVDSSIYFSNIILSTENLHDNDNR